MSFTIINHLFKELRADLSATGHPALFADGAPVLIYGAGNVGKDVFRLLTARGVSVLGFMDRGALPEATWQGVPVWQPDAAAALALQGCDCQVVIGIFNRDVEIPPVIAALNALGYVRVMTFMDLHDVFSSELGDRFWLTGRSYYADLEPQVAAGYELWEDAASQNLYLSMLRGRFTHNAAALPQPGTGPQYFPLDIPAWTSPLRFIDCGAFDGDTMQQLADTGLAIERVSRVRAGSGEFREAGKLCEGSALIFSRDCFLVPLRRPFLHGAIALLCGPR